MKITQLYYFLLLFFIIHSAKIKNGDLTLDYANAGYMKQLSFSFMLSTQIDSFDYIKVALPFPLHSQLTPAVPATQGLSSPSFLIVTYQTMDQFTTLTGTSKYAQVLTQTIDSSNYFIRFYNSDRKTLVSILNNQWYFLKFKLQSDQPLQYQKANSILQIQVSTVSSVLSNAIVYDDNLAFSYFSLASTPPSTISLISTPYNFGSSGGYLLTQATYDVYLDVTMSIDSSHYYNNLVLKFLISKQDSFTFVNGPCSSVAKINAPIIPILNATLYTCTVDSINNVMKVVLKPAALQTQNKFRFTVGIKNPPIVVKNVDIEVRAVKETSKVIIAAGTSSSALNTNQIYVTYQQIFIGWGLRPDALLPFDAKIFRGNAATPNYLPYNSISTKFSISQTTSSLVQLKIVINIPSQINAFVLQNGFTFNLPAFTNKEVKCRIQNADSSTLRQIGCTGIGSLVVGQIYQIGWKMFFPYDNYESSLNCTQFGTITVYTVQKITQKDISFFLGRSNQFLSYLKNSPDYYVIGRNSSYITYMKTFLNLNLVVLSNDFQQFLKQPESIYVTNRPKTYTDKVFNDVYVISQNLAFLTYISLFSDIYVAARLSSSSDIAKGLDSQPLISKTVPKNTLTISTVNSKDWTYFNPSTVPLVSSVLGGATNTPSTGLKQIATSQQSLVFSLQGIFSDVTTFSNTPATLITDNWGIQIMMSQKIKKGTSASALTQSSPSLLTMSIQTQDSITAYNKYTLITIKGGTSGTVQSIFPTSPTPVNFGVFPFTIQSFSSIYANQDNMDIMIATIDGIDGPLNRISYNGFFLINGFTMVDTPLGTLNMGFVNYQSSTSLKGDKVPTFLRIKGSIAASNVDSLAIFFDQLTPFYSNYYAGDIYCYSSDGAKFCNYYNGGQTLASKYNYQSMSRFQIALVTPSASFDILIPVFNADAQTITNFYVGYNTLISGKKSIAYIENLRTVSLTATAAATGSFGPTVTAKTVGTTVTNLNLFASGSGTITLNSVNNIGGSFSYFSQWDYFGSSSVTGWTQGPCRSIQYIYYYTNYDAYLTGSVFASSFKKIFGIVCFADSSSVSASGKTLTILSSKLPSKWGKTIPGFGAYSLSDGRISQLSSNYQTVGSAPSSNLITTPIVGPSLTKTLGKWIFNLPVSLNGDVKIVIIGDGANIPFTSSSPGTCAVYLGSVKTKVGCIFDSSSTELDYTLSINEEGLLSQNQDITILHYGMINSAVVQTNVNVNITCYSLVGNTLLTPPFIIWVANLVPILWQPTGVYLGPSQLKLNGFSKINLNKQAVSIFQFNFVLLSKGIYLTNRVRIDLGQLAIDNTNSPFTPRCIVLQYQENPITEIYSHDWAAVDSSQGLSNLQLWPQRDIYGNNLTYTVKCFDFKTTSSPDPNNVTAKIVNTSSDLTGDGVIFTQQIKPMILTYENNKSSQISITKKFSIPSSLLQITFSIVSPGITYDSILYLGFPSYYSNGLGPDIKCYTSQQIFCQIDNDRYLTVKYLGNYLQGVTFSLLVVGIVQPINYNSGSFYYLIDDDGNPIQVLSSGQFIDSVSSSVLVIQNFPTFPIYSLTQSSSYLRQEGVTIALDFYLSTSIPSISVGQSLYLIFPPIYADVLRFMPLTCTLNIKQNTLKNYINSCTITGLRLKMPFLDDLVLGSTYTLTINGIVNPTNPSAYVYKYSLQISDSSDTSIIAKSYSPQGNFIMPIFISNPTRLSLNYYTISSGLITSITSMTNLQSQQVFISSDANLTASLYQRNVYLSVQNTLYSIPSKIQLLSGTNPFGIRMASLTSGVNYVYFSKTGDGNFYSSLPPLTLITNKNYFKNLQFIQTSFNLPVATVGSNYSIIVNLPQNLYPMSQVQMTVTLGSVIGVILKNNPTIISFYPQKTSAIIDLQINDETLWVVSSSLVVTITPNDLNTYAGPATVTLNAVASSNNVPVLSIIPITPGKKQFVFNVRCSEYGKFIYHVSRKFSYNLSACALTSAQISYWIQQSSIDGLRVTQTYYLCNDILGTVNIMTPSVNQALTISNLEASTSYTISGFCQTQHKISSSLSLTSFDTLSNNGVVHKIDFYFESILTTSQKIKLSCALALFFKVDYFKVSTWDGYYCSQLLSRLLLDQTTLVQQRNNKNIQSEIMTQQKFLIEKQQQIKSQQRLLSSGTFRTDVYFGVNNGLNNDNTRGVVLSQSSLLNIKNQINNNVVGLPLLISYNVDRLSYVGTNQISGTPYIFSGPSYTLIKGISMPNDGLIYVIVGSSDWSRAPLISQIRQGSGPNGMPPLFFRVLPYRKSDSNSGNMAWIDMPQGQLKLYLLPSDDNPFDNAHYGAMVQFNITRQVPSFNKNLKLIGLILMVISIIIVL